MTKEDFLILLKDSEIFSALFLLIPLTLESLSGANSIISRVFSLNISTIAEAITGPTPFINPLARYFFIPLIVVG